MIHFQISDSIRDGRDARLEIKLTFGVLECLKLSSGVTQKLFFGVIVGLGGAFIYSGGGITASDQEIAIDKRNCANTGSAEYIGGEGMYRGHWGIERALKH